VGWLFVQGVDPRDTECEVRGSVYRVYFGHQPLAPEGSPQEHMGFHSDEDPLSGAVDVGEVLEWARTTAKPEQTFTLYVEHRHGDSPGLIHLMGVDPTVVPS
jgi:hypothetical protein